MHRSSRLSMQEFIKTLPQTGLLVCDVGSRNAAPTNIDVFVGTYRPYFKEHNYTGLDIQPGFNVDVVAIGPYEYPFEDEVFDVVVSGQVAEHVKDLHRWAKELARITKKDGLVYINCPHEWEEHRFPVDCWRILPDGMTFLLTEIAGMEIVSVTKNETDCIGIARKK